MILTLPRIAGALNSVAQPEQMGEDGGLRILVADDDDGFVALLHELVRGRGKVIGVAANGVEAIDEAKRLHPDVVLMDLDMPLLGGDDATRQILVSEPLTKVVIVSGDIEADRMEVWSSGAVAHIPKDDIAKQLPRVLDELSPFSVE